MTDVQATASSSSPLDPLSGLSTALAQLSARLERRLVTVGAGHRGVSATVFDEGLLLTSSRAVPRDEGLRGVHGAQRFELEVVGRDPGLDLLLLRFDPAELETALEPVSWRSEPPTVGELAVALALPGRSVRAALRMVGVVGASVRTPGGTKLEHYVQLDGELPLGFTGSVVVDASGSGLGIVTHPLGRRGSRAPSPLTIPGADLQKSVEALRSDGRVARGWLGVGAVPARLPKNLAQKIGQSRGVAVVSLEEGGPAERAGLFPGDIITKVAGESIASPIALRSAVVDHARAPIVFEVLRTGRTEDITIDVGTRP